MAIAKNPLIRYKILDQCFRNPWKKYFITDLIEECNRVLHEMDREIRGISRRQILEDISFMESSAGWSIDLERNREGKKVYYRYKDTDFSINNMPLNELEVLQLQSAIQILTQFNGMPQFEWINELVPKLRMGLKEDESSKNIISFDSNQYLKGIEYLGELFNAISYKKVLKIEYKDFKSGIPYEVTIHPYHLKQYNNRWFLFGYNPYKEGSIWNLALDRIQKIAESEEKYSNSANMDWDEYFEDIIGVTKPKDIRASKIVLIFNGVTCHYVLSKPLHGSQKSRWIEHELLEVELDLIINFEFKRLLLSYGENVRVVTPVSLIDSIQKSLMASFKNYE